MRRSRRSEPAPLLLLQRLQLKLNSRSTTYTVTTGLVGPFAITTRYLVAWLGLTTNE